MRYVGVVITAAIVLFSLNGIAMAIPQYYLFNGSVRSIGGDNTEIAVKQGFQKGKEVEYLFMLDSYVMGQVTYANNETEYSTENIFAELISGNVLDEVDGGYYLDNKISSNGNPGNALLGKALHLATIDDTSHKEILVGNEDKSILIKSNPDGSWNGYMHAYDSAGRKATVFLDLKLQTVTSEIPFPYNNAGTTLPEPISMFLLGTGLLGGASFICKRKKRPSPRGVISVSEH